MLAAALMAALAACGSFKAQDEQPGENGDDGADLAQVWVQHAAEQGWQVRALTRAIQCPVLRWQGGAQRLSLRAAPATLLPAGPALQPEARPAEFGLRSCEAAVPEGAAWMRLGGQDLPVPRQDIRRILVLADTGCRLKASEQAWQDCNDPQRWPWAANAASAAKLKPDLVVHLGDLHYRESPCPADRAGCAGSPWGYGDDAWQADFFQPAAPLLAAAPWLFVRGNHESCARAGAGWFRWFDARPWRAEAACLQPGAQPGDDDFSPPFALPLGLDSQLINFDSSATTGKAYAPSDAAYQRYQLHLAQADALVGRRPHNVFLKHHPVLGFGPSADGQPKPGTAGLMSVMQARHPARLYAQGVDLVLNGHVHLFEALGFASGHPSTLVLGHGGSAMAGHLDPALALRAQPTTGAAVNHFSTLPGFGHALLERLDGGVWRLTEHGVDSQVRLTCHLSGSAMRCNQTAR